MVDRPEDSPHPALPQRSGRGFREERIETGHFSPSLVVTTANHFTPEVEARARETAAEIGAPFAPRQDRSLVRLTAETGAGRLLVFGITRITLRDVASGAEYDFHPNMVPVRAHNRKRGARDLFLEATGLGPGDSLLDCTLGFGAEATLAALAVGDGGTVVGLESVPALAVVTREGLGRFPLPQADTAAAMRRVRVVIADYRDYLPRCPDGAFDVVCFDPFFHARLPGAQPSVDPLFYFGDPSPLDPDAVREARRVARRRVVVKHPWREPLPPEVAGAVTQLVTARHGRLVYSVIESL